jgi:hexokinase
MSKIFSTCNEYLSPVTDYVKNAIYFKTLSAKNLTGKLITNNENSIEFSSSISHQSSSLVSENTVKLAAKVIGISLATASLFGTGFYIGYQLSRKRHRFHVRETDKNDQIEHILGKLKLNKEALHNIMQLMLEEMHKGLDKATHDNADIKMFPTYVRSLPDGTERGEILALDLGGTNFRVLLINLEAGDIKVKSKVFLIPQSIMTGTGIQLFDHIAKCLAEFMKAEHLADPAKVYPLGFTFSFPCTQHGLASATLVTWTKGFDCSDVVGHDVVKMLQEAIERRHDIKVNVMALVNDTVGTLMASAYHDRNTRIGLILGTGSNACYVENLDLVKTWVIAN